MNRSISDINGKDVLFVGLYGIFLSILMGIAIGLIDSFISTQISFSLSFIFFFFSSRWLGRTIRRLYNYPHVLYVIIAFIGLLIQAVIILVLQLHSRVYNIVEYPEIFLNELIYIETIKNVIKATFSGGIFNFINYMITYLLYGVGIYIGLRETY